MPRNEEPPFWGMVELQGDVESRNQTPLEDQFVGDLHYTNQVGPILATVLIELPPKDV